MGGDPAAEQLEAAQAALEDGHWQDARDSFGELVERDPDPDALAGLATAQWWLNDVADAFANWERAYAGYVERGDPVSAIVVAVTLSLLCKANLGNTVLSRGWASRAARLAEPLGEAVLDGWVLLARATTAAPAQSETWSRQAHEIGVAEGDRDLELSALSSLGHALVEMGRSTEGAELLDEALVGSLAGEAQLDTVVFASCLLMQSCYRCADFDRLLQWSKRLDPFVSRYGCPYVNSTCRAHHGGVLVATGRWDDAERELDVALKLAGDALPVVRAEALAFLAELRVGQGRTEEARALLAGYEAFDVAIPTLAAARLADGHHEVATSLLQRRLEGVDEHDLVTSHMAELLGHARLASGDVTDAERIGAELVALGTATDCGLLMARGERLLGLVAQSDDPDRAVASLDRAVRRFTTMGLAVEAASTRKLLAAALDAAGQREAALAEAQSAFAELHRIGVVRLADAIAAWVRERGGTVTRAAGSASDLLTRREREVFAAVAEGLTNPEIAQRLYISRRTVEHHVANVLAKLGVRNRAELAAHASRERAEPAPK